MEAKAGLGEKAGGNGEEYRTNGAVVSTDRGERCALRRHATTYRRGHGYDWGMAKPLLPDMLLREVAASVGLP